MTTLIKTLPVVAALHESRRAPKTHPGVFKRGLSHVSLYDRKLVAVMAHHGIVDPWDTLHAARHVHAHLSVCCAMLQMESSGGLNEFGADPTGPNGALFPEWYDTKVTQAKYEIYKQRRDLGHLPNGVGPCQLTDVQLQRGADARGGCWIPLHNMTEGFDFLRRVIAASGSLWIGFRNYNGSGGAANRYADAALELQHDWYFRFKEVR